jgi:cellulose synthase/poly-beta-1,6-N-acetylglucosamine synthase-like glycosyltransferase
MTGIAHLIGAALFVLALPGTLLLAILTVGAFVPARPGARGRVSDAGASAGDRQGTASTVASSTVAAAPTGRIAVVVPAHDEQDGIAATVASLRADADAQTEIVVVADNCSDATAQRARAAGARVLVRDNPARRGKGYALDFAFERLLREPFDAFVVVDADSEVNAGFFAAMRAALDAGAQAAQAAYLPLGDALDARARLVRLARLAWNVLRLRGRERLGLSVGVLGNGFALTRETLVAVPYRARSIVEDVEYHASLVRAGRRVRFVEDALVRGDMPTAGAAAASQRARWEGGRLRMLAQLGAPLIRDITLGGWRLVEPLAELALLPLAYHCGLLLAALLLGSGTVAWLASIALAVVALHVAAAFVIGRCGWRDAAAFALVPVYVARKAFGLGAVLRAARAGTPWVRTARESSK